ncbi:MAG: FAD-dependent monooxygenase [Kofleriaceae bacterium]
MKLACIGGGPAGLYLGILVKRAAPEHEVVVYERNRPAETFGFGVVFSDATLGHLAAADPETHAQITSRFARWDDIEIHVKGEVLRSTGHGFCGLERKALLQILQARARELGVQVVYEHEVRSLAEVSADLIVASDGVASWVRDALATELQPSVDVRTNKFTWLGCTVPYRAFTFLFQDTPDGMFRVHAYRYHEHGSTFIVECREPTWRSAGLADADEDRTVAIVGEIFKDHLGGHTLIKNRSIWRNFPTVRCAKWSAHAPNGTPVVLLGDAAHTAHFSIGSGTKLAMEDSIVLRDELLAQRDLASALAGYEAKRRPEVEALQAAAQASLEWFEGTERYAKMAPAQFTYSLMTRSLRVSHASVAKRDPHLARGVEQLLAAKVGITRDPPLPPTALPYTLGSVRAQNRIAVAGRPTHAGEFAGDDDLVALGSAATAGAGIVVTPVIPIHSAPLFDGAAPPGKAGLAPAATPLAGPRINTDEQAVAWRRIVDFVHAKDAIVVARIATTNAVPGALEAAVERAAFAGFDLLLLDPGADDPDGVAVEHLPAMVHTARAKWTRGRWIAAWIHDRPHARAGILGTCAQLVRAGCDQLWVQSAGDARMAGARLPAAPLADRLRNELAISTAVVADATASLPDLDASIAAGRADLVVVTAMPGGFARRS